MVVCSSIQEGTWTHDGIQWSLEVFPPGRPPNKVIEHTIDLMLRRIEELSEFVQSMIAWLIKGRCVSSWQINARGR